MKGLHDASRSGGTAIDTYSHSGAVLAQNLVQIATTASQVTGSAKTQANAINTARDAMIALAHAHGLTIPAARSLTNGLLDNANAADVAKQEMANLIAQYHLTPSEVKTAIAATGATTAAGQVKALRDYIDQLHNKSVSISVVTTQTQINKVLTQLGPGMGTTQADGGLLENLQRMAGGGFPTIGSQQPQIQPNHGKRGITWAETGAGPWEAFISGAPEKADRSRSIADQVVGRLGGVVQWMADGGRLSGPLQHIADGGTGQQGWARSNPVTAPPSVSPAHLEAAVNRAVNGARFVLDIGSQQSLKGIIRTGADDVVDSAGAFAARQRRARPS